MPCIPELQAKSADFVVLNFANPDMVGHTGVFEAVVKAVETTDACARAVVEAALAAGYASIIIADHGNAEFMRNADGSPNTAHTTNLVPCILADNDYHGTLADGKLGDLARHHSGTDGRAQAGRDDGQLSLLRPSLTTPRMRKRGAVAVGGLACCALAAGGLRRGQARPRPPARRPLYFDVKGLLARQVRSSWTQRHAAVTKHVRLRAEAPRKPCACPP